MRRFYWSCRFSDIIHLACMQNRKRKLSQSNYVYFTILYDSSIYLESASDCTAEYSPCFNIIYHILCGVTDLMWKNCDTRKDFRQQRQELKVRESNYKENEHMEGIAW